MSQLVIDTGVHAKFLFSEAYSEQTADLFADVERVGWRMFAPLNLPAELSNVIRRRMRREGLTLPDALAALEIFIALPLTLVGGAELYRQALRLTERYSFSTYDAQFVAIAQHLSCDVWTADEAQRRAAGARLPFVRWIGDYNGQVM